MWRKWTPPAGLDPLIQPAVILLNEYGFSTFESCQGGTGHAYPQPTIRFEGNEFDLIRAYEVCHAHNLCIDDVKRVYRKCTDLYKDPEELDANPNSWKIENIIGQTWEPPCNEITFTIHPKTGTIFLPD